MAEKIRVDVWMEILYPVAHPERLVIDGNIKREMLSEVLSNYIMDVMVLSNMKDPAPANKDAVTYIIKLGLRLADDAYACEDNCGNRDLRNGILWDVLGRIERKELTDVNFKQ